MAALPANPTFTISPAEMQILVSRAGLVLNPGQVADLVLAWRQVAGLIAGLPHERPLADDMAYSFRIAPPAGVTSSTARAESQVAPTARAKPQPERARPVRPAKPEPQPRRAKAKTAAKTKAPAKAKAKAPAKTRIKARAKPARKATAPRRARRRR